VQYFMVAGAVGRPDLACELSASWLRTWQQAPQKGVLR
jgi:hypothetical protein